MRCFSFYFPLFLVTTPTWMHDIQYPPCAAPLLGPPLLSAVEILYIQVQYSVLLKYTETCSVRAGPLEKSGQSPSLRTGLSPFKRLAEGEEGERQFPASSLLYSSVGLSTS